MTGVADIGCWHMAGRFTRCRSAVMTGITTAQYLGMIHRAGRNGCPVRRKFLMAGITQVAGIDMPRVLAAGITTGGTGVAGNAVAGKTAVDEMSR